MARTLRVASIQVQSKNGGMAGNLTHAEPFVEQAATGGAKLVLCPEFLATGYIYDESIWEAGERAGGLTESWLARLARTHGVFIGASFLEAEGEDFFNTFSLFGPDGALRGRVRKASLPFFEGWFFTPCSGSKLIETELGRIAVGICNDTQTAGFLGQVCEGRPDLILMPHSAPTPNLPRALQNLFVAQLRDTAARYARELGVPVVMSNKAAAHPGKTPLPVVPGVRISWRFRGFSSIWDGDGSERASLVDEEGVLLGDVSLDPSRKISAVAPTRGYWSFGPGLGERALGGFLLTLEALGKRAYRKSARRAELARRLTRS